MKTMAYKSKGMKLGAQGESKAQAEGSQSKAPAHKPSMQPSVPSKEMASPSMAPEHKKKALPTQNAPKGVVSGPNAGQSMAMPKGGGVGETEV